MNLKEMNIQRIIEKRDELEKELTKLGESKLDKTIRKAYESELDEIAKEVKSRL